MTTLAKHVAVIMDGNGRWANERMLPRYHGHNAGVKAAENIINAAVKNGIQYLTLFALSSENILRPKAEISFLTTIFYKNISERLNEFHSNNIKINFIGDLSYFNHDLNNKMQEAMELTKDNTGMVFTVALNYGGRWDIVQACNRLLADENFNGIVTEEIFNNNLSMAGLPDPDLLIRTGREKRISNFLIWYLAYSELYFSDKYWPDFSEADFEDALNFFSQRNRRFGMAKDLIAR
jgi:undecaprenyl diphosphate synthase